MRLHERPSTSGLMFGVGSSDERTCTRFCIDGFVHYGKTSATTLHYQGNDDFGFGLDPSGSFDAPC